MVTSLQTLASYVPEALLADLALEARPPSEARAVARKAAVLRVELAGIAAFVARMSRRGPGGVEGLSVRLNDFVACIIERVRRTGGDVLELDGPALLVAWVVSEHDTPEGVCARAAHATASLAWQTPEASPELQVSLTMGLGFGDLCLSRVGGALGNWRLVLSGSGLAQARAAAREASAGDVRCSPAFWALMTAEEQEIIRGMAPAELPALTRRRPTHAGPGFARGFVPGLARDRLTAGLPDWIAEQRTLTVVSVRLQGVGGDAGELEHLQAAARVAQEALYRHEGELFSITLCERGVSVVGVLGAPQRHDDDPTRAVRAAISIRDGLRAMAIPTAIGVATGRVFCGTVGCETRRGYALLGDAITLSGQLMGRATAGVILCDAATRQAADRVAFRALGDMALPGGRQHMSVYIPLGIKDIGARLLSVRTPIQGREAERRVLFEGLDALQRGEGSQTVVLIGPAGIGKSRLLMEGMSEAHKRGMRVLVGAAEPAQHRTPLFVWRRVLREALGVGSTRDERQVAARVEAALGGDETLTPLIPLINAVIPGAVPETPWTSGLDGEGRAEHTRTLLAALLRRYAADGTPVVVILDDVHWLDSASLAFLEALTCRAPELHLLLASRPSGGAEQVSLDRICDLRGARVLSVDPLPERASARIAARALGVDAVPTSLTQLLMARTDGNPLYIIELVQGLRERGALVVEGRRCAVDGALSRQESELPPTLSAVVDERVGRLREVTRAVARAASAYASSFVEDDVSAVWRAVWVDAGSQAAVAEQLIALEGAGLLRRFAGLDGHTRWEFVHHLVREAVYSRMDDEAAAPLHAAIAAHLEAAHREGRRIAPAVLSYHWGRSSVLYKAVPTLDAAALAAVRQDATVEGIQLFTEALEVGEAAPLALRLRWLIWLARLLHRRGRAEEASEHLALALSLLGRRAPSGAVTLWLGLGMEGARLSARLLGLNALARLGRPAETQAPAGMAAAAWLTWALVQDHALELLEARYATLRAYNVAVSGSVEQAVAAATLSCMATRSGHHRWAALLQHRAERHLAQVTDPDAEGSVRMAFGEAALARGRWELAREQLERAGGLLETAGRQRSRDRCALLCCAIESRAAPTDEVLSMCVAIAARGDRRRCTQIQVRGRVMAATLHRHRGELAAGVRRLREAAELARVDTDVDTSTELLAQAGLGMALADAGNLGAAAAVAAALDLDPKLGPCALEAGSQLAALMAELSGRLWERHAMLPELEVSQLRRRARRAARMLREVSRGLPLNRPAAARWEGRVLLKDGLHTLALRRWKAGLADAEALGMMREAALLHAEIAAAGGGAQHRSSAEAILTALGLDPIAVLSTAGLIGAEPWSDAGLARSA